jgi:ribosomal protein S15P/S13E
MTNIYDENGSVRVPVGVTDDWIKALDAEGIPKNQQRILIQKAEELGEKAAAEEKLIAVREARDNRQHAVLKSMTDTELNQSALLSIDHIRGTLLVAQKLNDLITKHTTPRDGQTKSGNINTVLDYILAHIFLLEGIKISKKPLHDLRAVHTPEHADTCGISHKNLSLLWKCLISIHKSGESIPLGDEIQLFDRTRTMTKHAEDNKKDEDDAKQKLGTLQNRQRRLDAHIKARHAFFPDLAIYSDHIHLGEISRNLAKNDAGDTSVEGGISLGTGSGKGAKMAGKKSRTGDRGKKESKTARLNRELAERIVGL